MAPVDVSEDTKNWLKAVLALKHLKNGLLPFVDNQISTFHNSLTYTHGVCILCSIENVLPCPTRNACLRRGRICQFHDNPHNQHRPCPGGVCENIRDDIVRNHFKGEPMWKNTDATKWSINAWEVAKCFLPPGSKDASSSADTDCTGIISLTLHCKILTDLIDHHGIKLMFEKNRDNRNVLMHSGSQELSDTDRSSFIQDAVQLLSTFQTPVDRKTQDCIDTLNEIDSDGWLLTTDDIVDVMKDKVEAVRLKQGKLDASLTKTNETVAKNTDELEAYKEQIREIDADLKEAHSMIKNLKDIDVKELGKRMESIRKHNEDMIVQINRWIDALETTVKEHIERHKQHDKRFEGHDQQHKQYDQRLDDHDQQHKQHDQRFEGHDQQHKQYDQRLDDHDQQHKQHDQRLEGHDQQHKQHDKRLEEHDKRLEEHDQQHKQHDQRLEGHDQQHKQHDERLEGHDQRHTKHDKRLEGHDGRLEGLADKKNEAVLYDPSPNDLNRAYKILGRTSPVLERMCLNICGKIKATLKHIKNVWPGYMSTTCENVDDSVMFVVVQYTGPRMYGNVMGFKVLFCKEDDCNNEGEIINNSRERKNKPFTTEEMNRSRGENTHRLITSLTSSHSNINCVMFSSVKSKNFKEGETPSIYRDTCVVIYVHIKGVIPLLEEAFPKELGGFPVDVREGFTKLYVGPFEKHNPLKMGCAITRGQMGGNLTFGTIGAFVDRDDEQFCLTSAHVIASISEIKEAKKAGALTEFSSSSVPVYQPPRLPREDSDQFGELREIMYESGVESGVGIEIALVKVNSRFPESGEFPDEGKFESAGFKSQPMTFNSGEISDSDVSTQEVVKYGCSTKITKGQLGMGGVYFKKEMVGFTLELHGQIDVLNDKTGSFADDGDSGALVFDSRNKTDLRPVGMIVGGNSAGNTVITPVSKIMSKLGVKTFKTFAVSGPDMVPGMVPGGIGQYSGGATNHVKQKVIGKTNKLDTIPAFPTQTPDELQRIGKITFSLQNLLGRGAKSVVFSGFLEDGIPVAVKQLIFTSAKEKIHREKQIISYVQQFRHKNIVGYYLSETVSNNLYIAMELCHGTLFDYVKEEKSEWRLIYPPIAVNKDMAEGLEFLHSKNLAHRDLSPGNVLFVVHETSDSRVCLSDFGNAKTTVDGIYSISDPVGTQGYIPPELFRDCGAKYKVNDHANAAADVFSMGLLFYFAHTVGCHPFGEEMLRHVNIVKKENPSFDCLSKNDFTLQSLIEAMICHDPTRRPNMKEVVDHPALWCEKRILTYLQQSSDQMEALILCNKMDDEPMKDTYLIPHGNWKKNLPDTIQKYIKTLKVGNTLMYAGKGNSPRYLLRFIRNMEHHFHQCPEDVKTALGKTEKERVTFWAKQCPGLLLKVFKAMGVNS